MTNNVELCGRPFDEELLSGYLDGALTQADEQRVRLHVEECEECGDLLAEMRTLREAAMTTHLEPPTDDQWNEAPKSVTSRLARNLGWVLLALWLVGLLAFAGWEMFLGDGEVEELAGKMLGVGSVSGLFLIFLSVLLDRLRARKADRYKGVKK